MKTRLFLMVMGLMLVMFCYTSALVPQMINYQGKLTKVSGAPLDTTIQMVYTIYADSNGITSKWSESQTSVKVEKGIFNVLLGSVNLIPDSVFDGSIRYLGVKVGTDPEITPRKAMVSVPYAYRAGAGGGGNDYKWIFRITDTADTSITTGGRWGIARYDNTLYGNADSTHVNLGVACITGASGQNYKYCTVGGGVGNTASGWYAIVGGGGGNTATGNHSTVGGGYDNKASYGDATVGGGYADTASGSNATVGGGGYSTASGNFATVGGGYHNTASALDATVGGGQSNTASGGLATVGGGSINVASGDSATVVGGARNTASGNSATVGGGAHNTASGNRATVGGGYADTASGNAATVGGGYSNTASGDSATVGGGRQNTASGNLATVGGGRDNTASMSWATIGGGHNNTVSAVNATVGGGWGDTASGNFATVSGGEINIASGNAATVGGGWDNTVSGYIATVGGGIGNAASYDYTTVGGGYYNTASGYSATVGGGYYNTASGYSATVGGGVLNSASGWEATVGGGVWDTSAANYSFTVGNHSVVPSGYNNSVAFNGQTATASGQTRVNILSKASGSFTIDHPLDPNNKILNHYFIESPEMVNIYRGAAHLDANGRAEVHLPDYFDALNRTPMVQLTGVGTSDVYVAEKVTGNRFVIGGKPGTEVYWMVTGDRKDQSAEITRIIMPVEQVKTDALAGRSLDDDFLGSTMQQLERMGEAGKFSFRTTAGRQRYEDMKRKPEEKKPER